MASRRGMYEGEDFGTSESEPKRYGGTQSDDEEEAKRKLEERERKKAEVRKRLEEAGKAKKSQKGLFDT